MARQICRVLTGIALLSTNIAIASASARPTHGYWVGTIGDLSAQMDLDTTGTKPAGSYFYEKTGIPLTLTGTVESDGTLRLTEQTPKQNVTGSFRGALPGEGGTFSGIWTAADGSKSLPFRFHEAAAFGTLAVPPARDFSGTFHYPVLAAADNAGAQVNAEIEGFARDERDRFLADVRKAGQGAKLSPPWEADLNWEIHYDGSTLVCLLATGYQFTGGAHGIVYCRAFNYYVRGENATPITLNDLFLSKSEFIPTLSRLCVAQLTDKEAAWVMNGQVKGLSEKDLSTFLLGPDGLTFVFAPYEVGPWAQGMFQVTVGYRELKGLLNPEGPCARFTARAVASASKKEPRIAAVVEAKPAAASIKAARKPAHRDKPLSQEEAVKLIAELPEVRRYFSTIEQISHKQGRAIAMGQGHGGDPNAWEVYVGEEHPDRSACWNRFRVDQRTGAILVWNAPSYNALIPLDQWRQQQSARASGE
ncbi:MAG TPA: DUF3298 and DUF4163 domain-containing protein [Tepidisphaeraceae bacterium]